MFCSSLFEMNPKWKLLLESIIHININKLTYFIEVASVFYHLLFPSWTKPTLVYFHASENSKNKETLVSLEEQSDISKQVGDEAFTASLWRDVPVKGWTSRALPCRVRRMPLGECWCRLQEQMAFLSMSLTCCQLLLAAQGGPCTPCTIIF